MLSMPQAPKKPQAPKSNNLSPEHLQLAKAQGLNVDNLTPKQLTTLENLSIEQLRVVIINGITLINYIEQQMSLNDQKGQVISQDIIRPLFSTSSVIITSRII